MTVSHALKKQFLIRCLTVVIKEFLEKETDDLRLFFDNDLRFLKQFH